jgi:hypothetical protein
VSSIKKIRFTDPNGGQDTVGSQCRIAEIELFGWKMYDTTALVSTPTICDIEGWVNSVALTTISSIVTYSSA